MAVALTPRVWLLLPGEDPNEAVAKSVGDDVLVCEDVETARQVLAGLGADPDDIARAFHFAQVDEVLKHGTHNQKTHGRRGSARSLFARAAAGGFTVDLLGNRYPKRGTVVALPGFTRRFTPEAFDQAALDQYVLDHADRLDAGRVMLGGWLSEEFNEVVLDLVEIYDDEDEAVRIGRDRGEEGVYTLHTQTYIPTGGTGGREDSGVIGKSSGAVRSPEADPGDDGRGEAGVGRPGVPGDAELQAAVAKHGGPGPHKTGTPQEVHGGGVERRIRKPGFARPGDDVVTAPKIPDWQVVFSEEQQAFDAYVNLVAMTSQTDVNAAQEAMVELLGDNDLPPLGRERGKLVAAAITRAKEIHTKREADQQARDEIRREAFDYMASRGLSREGAEYLWDEHVGEGAGWRALTPEVVRRRYTHQLMPRIQEQKDKEIARQKAEDEANAAKIQARLDMAANDPTPDTAPAHVGQQWHSLVKRIHHESMVETGANPALINHKLADLLQHADVYTRVSTTVLMRVIHDGRFRSQHETGSSNGAYNPRQRRIKELVLHGTDVDSGAPGTIYGYLHDDGRGGVGHDRYSDYSNLEQYGDIAIKFRSSVRDRSTFLFGDSLDDSGVHRLGYLGGIDEETGEVDTSHPLVASISMSPVPVNDPTHLAIPKRYLDMESVESASTLAGLDTGYTEAQIHGGLSTDDIEAVYIPAENFDYGYLHDVEVQEILRRGIQIFIVEDDGDGDSVVTPLADSGYADLAGDVEFPVAEVVEEIIEVDGQESLFKHGGPGPHSTGSPQSSHAGTPIIPLVVGLRARANTLAWMNERDLTPDALYANTAAILDRASPAAISYGTSWYANAHDIADGMAAEHGVSRQVATGVIAALSPRGKWRNPDDPKHRTQGNIADAHRVLTAVANPGTIRPTPEAAAYAKRLYKIDIDHLVGRDVDLATVDPVTFAALHPDLSGLPDNLIKAVRIARGEDPDLVLGGPKVRSFYNNILHPESDESVTVDSHQVRAMIGRIDLPDKVYEEIAGNPARYEYFAEVVKDLARDRGIPPHVVQAIVWEQWRIEHPEDTRSKQNSSNLGTGGAKDVQLGSVVYAAPTQVKTRRSGRTRPQ